MSIAITVNDRQYLIPQSAVETSRYLARDIESGFDPEKKLRITDPFWPDRAFNILVDYWRTGTLTVPQNLQDLADLIYLADYFIMDTLLAQLSLLDFSQFSLEELTSIFDTIIDDNIRTAIVYAVLGKTLEKEKIPEQIRSYLEKIVTADVSTYRQGPIVLKLVPFKSQPSPNPNDLRIPPNGILLPTGGPYRIHPLTIPKYIREGRDVVPATDIKTGEFYYLACSHSNLTKISAKKQRNRRTGKIEAILSCSLKSDLDHPLTLPRHLAELKVAATSMGYFVFSNISPGDDYALILNPVINDLYRCVYPA